MFPRITNARGLDGPRVPRPDELGAVTDLSNTVFCPDARTMGLEFPLLFSQENLRRLRIFSSGGRPVSLAGYVQHDLIVEGHRIPAASLGSVCTLPEYRGQGLAAALVSDILRELSRAGLALLIISGDGELYTRMGASAAGDFVRYELDPAMLPQKADAEAHRTVSVRPFRAGDLEQVHAVYRREPVRFSRTVGEFNALIWQHPGKERLHAQERLSVVSSDTLAGEEISAYIVTRARRGEDGKFRVHIAEYAGTRSDVICAMGATARELRPSVMTLTVPASDRDSIRALRDAGVSGSRGALPRHTMVIPDVGSLIQALLPLVHERAGIQPHAASALLGNASERAGDARLYNPRLEGTEVPPENMSFLTRLVFGHLTRQETDALARNSELHALAERAFPVPLPVPGLNYV
ncbi:MAG: GNAT family N-acetyltransferase [Firmicutes bacterium]|jgi:GNAT superfamily N-acetyltransferase|nr:GNAT family N-acetyltransferase [Bacillota bacterium]